MNVNEVGEEVKKEERLLRRMALVAVYENDEGLIKELEKRGFKDYKAILEKAKEHEDFDEGILLAKEFTRLSLDHRTDPEILMEIEKSLEKLGISNSRLIDSFAQIIPIDFDDLDQFLSQRTRDFFLERKRVRREADERTSRLLHKGV